MTYMLLLNGALKLVEDIILYYDARSKKHQIMKPVSLHLRAFLVRSAVENREVSSYVDCPVTFGQSCFWCYSQSEMSWVVFQAVYSVTIII